MSTGEIVAFLDDDAIATPDWLAHMATAYADPGVVGVGGSDPAPAGPRATALVPGRVRLGGGLLPPGDAAAASRSET